MAGWRLVNKLALGVAAWLMLLSTVAFSAPQGGPVAIIVSDTEEAYTLPVKTFEAEMESEVRVFNLRGDLDRAPALMAEVLAVRPSLLFALGAKAACVAKVWTRERPELPVLFAMVLNWQRYGLMDGQKNIFGIDSDVDPGIQFAHMLLVSPGISRVGVIYNSDLSGQVVAKARDAAKVLGVELIEQAIRQPQQLERAYLEIDEKIDALLILADPVVYTLENIAWLEKSCIRDRIICVGQSGNAAKLGVLMAIEPDIPNIGAQAASLAKSVIAGRQRPDEVGVKSPLGTKVYLNMRTAEKIGLTLSRAAISMASEVYNGQ